MENESPHQLGVGKDHVRSGCYRLEIPIYDAYALTVIGLGGAA